ncbi:MAG: LytTR family DNA-binding domain-containing protein [Bacteroidota bacterium]
MIRRFLTLLNEPFPDNSDLKSLTYNILGVGLFVTFFLYLIRPFDIDRYPKDPFWICLGFGAVTVVIGWIYEWSMIKGLKIRRDLPTWTLKKWIFSTLLLIVMIALGNFLYMNLLFNFYAMGWSNFLTMFYNTILVGIFPIIFAGLVIQMRALKANQNRAETIQAQLETAPPSRQMIQLSAQNQKQVMDLQLDEFYFAESMQNYVAIHHWQGAKMQKQLLRNTIANLEQQLSQTSIIRCHRSYLINCSLVVQVNGNAQGLKVRLKNHSDEIPVSRKYIAAFREKLDTSLK